MNPYRKFERKKKALQINTNNFDPWLKYAACTNHLSYEKVLL